jgi:hypothetical protein
VDDSAEMLKGTALPLSVAAAVQAAILKRSPMCVCVCVFSHRHARDPEGHSPPVIRSSSCLGSHFKTLSDVCVCVCFPTGMPEILKGTALPLSIAEPVQAAIKKGAPVLFVFPQACQRS